MHKAMLLLAVLGLAEPLWAADPIIGTWKLNAEKSRFSPVFLALQKLSVPDKESKGIEIYAEITGDKIELTRMFVRKNGSSSSARYIWPLQGGTVEVPKNYANTIVETFIAPGEWYATFLKDGKQLRVLHKVVSKDGKTLNHTGLVWAGGLLSPHG